MPHKIISPTTMHSPAPVPHITKRNAAAKLHHFTHRDPVTGTVDPDITVSVAVPTSNQATTPPHLQATPTVKDFPATTNVGDVPGRHIVNLYFQDANGKPVNHFDPPVELRVKLTSDDHDRRKNKGTPFKLVYWDNRQWVEIPDQWVARHVTNEKFFQDPSVSAGGGDDLVVQLVYWPDDPGIGSGP